MDGLLFWPLFGALMGGLAAQKRGFSLAGGLICGALLGPFAILMFFMSGILSSSAA